MKLWPGYWDNQLERMNMNVDEDYGKYVGMVNGRAWKVQWFSINEFWKNIGCLVSAPTFGLGGYRLYNNEEEQKILEKLEETFN